MDFKKQSLLFFATQKQYVVMGLRESDFESEALEYVKKTSGFKYKDEVEAAVLVQELQDMGFLEFIKRENNKRYHKITSEGLNYLDTM